MRLDKRRAFNEFIASIANACNDSGLLYRDRIGQDELYDAQVKITKALMRAYQEGIISMEQLFNFQNVFYIEDEQD